MGKRKRAGRPRRLPGFATPGILKRIRSGAGWSQVEFAEVLGVHPRTLQLWESGRIAPSRRVNDGLRVATEKIGEVRMDRFFLEATTEEWIRGLVRQAFGLPARTEMRSGVEA